MLSISCLRESGMKKIYEKPALAKAQATLQAVTAQTRITGGDSEM